MSNRQFTADELGAKWGAILNQVLVIIVGLEKQLTAQNELMQEFRANEATLVAHIQSLEGQLSVTQDAAEAEGARDSFVKSFSNLDDKEKTAPDEMTEA